VCAPLRSNGSGAVEIFIRKLITASPTPAASPRCLDDARRFGLVRYLGAPMNFRTSTEYLFRQASILPSGRVPKGYLR